MSQYNEIFPSIEKCECCVHITEKERNVLFNDTLNFRHRASCILGQAFRYFPENAFYIFNQQIYFII